MAHMAASIGQQKAHAVVTAVLVEMNLPAVGQISADHGDQLLTRLSMEPGLVGLAAKVTRQMVKMKMTPQKPAF